MTTIESFIRGEETAKNLPLVEKAPDNWRDVYFSSLIILMSQRYGVGEICVGPMAANDDVKYKLSIDQLAEVADTAETAGYEVNRAGLGIFRDVPSIDISWRHRMP